ncbi:unnamed protein product [Caenorhabditis brenneri]
MTSQKPPCPTLKKLCLPVVVENYRKGVHCDISGKLTTAISDMIFEKLHTPHVKIPKDLRKRIEDNFCISRLTLGENNYEKENLDMIHAQMITKLVLLNLKTSTICTQNPNGKKKGFGKRLDIDWFIKKYLNKNCWPLLESLIIQGTGVAFSQGWITQIHDRFPAITILDITGCSLANDEFKILCNNFSELTSLSIGKTKVNDLNQIEQLTELKYLSLEDLEFKKESCLYSVFLLKNLIALNISSNSRFANTAELLTKRKSPLPHLQFLDLCGNKLSVETETLKTLLTQHPNVKHVSVINTTHDRRPQNEFLQFKEGVHFFTVFDLDACSTSLMIYSSHEMRSQAILTRVREIITTQLGNQEELDLKKCAKALSLVLISSTQNYQNQFTAAECLHTMFSHRLVFSLFTTKEREEVARAVVQVVTVADWTDRRTPVAGYDLFNVGTKILMNFGILVDNLDLIKSSSMAMLRTFAKHLRNRDDIQVLHMFSGFLIRNKEVLQAFPLTNKEYGNLGFSIRFILEERYPCSRAHQSLLELLTIMLGLKNRINHYSNDEILIALLSSMGPFRGNQYLLEMTFDCAQSLCTSDGVDVLKVFRPHCFGNIKKAMRSIQSFALRAASKFLLQIHKFHSDGVIYTNEELEELVHEIVLLAGPLGFFCCHDVFALIIEKSNNARIRIWAQWISSNQIQLRP